MLDAFGTVLANLFIVAMLFWMVMWDAEPQNPIRRYLVPRIQRPFIWLGLNAEWRMFAYDPPMRDSWPMAVLTLHDGQLHTWEPTPFAELGFWRKQGYKKLHKYFYSVVGLSTGRVLYPDFVDYVLRDSGLAGECRKIELYVVLRDTPMLGSAAREPARRRLLFTSHPSGQRDD
jgi:hypothetical protein